MDGREALGAYLVANMSRAELCKRAPISNGHLSLFLNGKRGLSRKKAKQISAIVGIPAAKLLDVEAE